jgi:hypothetical protein
LRLFLDQNDVRKTLWDQVIAAVETPFGGKGMGVSSCKDPQPKAIGTIGINRTEDIRMRYGHLVPLRRQRTA